MNLTDNLPQERLTRAEEDALSRKIQRSNGNDQAAINKLVLHSMVEAFLYGKKVCDARLEDREIFSVCYKELTRSAKRFKTGYNRFFAFVKPGIRGALNRFWTTKDVVKHVSSENIVTLDGWGEASREATAEGITLNTGVREFEEPCCDADFDGMEIRAKMAMIEPIMREKLTEQEYMVLDLIYIAGFNCQEIADMLDVGRSAIQGSQIKGIQKIRDELTRRGQLLVREDENT